MTFSSWLFRDHPFFAELRRKILGVLELGDVDSLDKLTVRCRRPGRTVLLGLDVLTREREVSITPAGLRAVSPHSDPSPPPERPQRTWAFDVGDPSLCARYTECLATRAEPGLLWGQRWLTPDSAIDRAFYIISQFDRREGTAIFLGDDDLVSPLVAALTPRWHVHVVDIDRAVLEKTRSIAEALGHPLTTEHGDLSQMDRHRSAGRDVVVCDPFPSGDGSFEALFWRHAAEMLRPGGLLITTAAPSHKPPAYAFGALRQLDRLGFCLADLQVNYGRYEVFDFEFIPYERDLLGRLGLRATVSHTKSLLTARLSRPWDWQGALAEAEFNFTGWSQAALHHYLTVQAGVEHQQHLTRERGPLTARANSTPQRQQGLRVDLLFPPDLTGPDGLYPEAVTEEEIRSLGREIGKRQGIVITEEEVRELVRLTTTVEIQPNGPLAPLGLAARAIESWERWRFDARRPNRDDEHLA